MKYFSGAREAKEFLATQITHEAELEGAPLSDVEHKMLYFTESGWTLPDMAQISDEFDRDYDQDVYETKIARLVKSGYKRAAKTQGDEYDKWWHAIRLLNTEDHYISVLIDRAGLRPRYDRLKLWATASAIVGSFLLITFMLAKYDVDPSKYFPDRDDVERFIWGTLASVAALYVAARLLFGGRVDDLLLNLGLRMMGRPKPSGKRDSAR
jgi:hypothetical protein